MYSYSPGLHVLVNVVIRHVVSNDYIDKYVLVNVVIRHVVANDYIDKLLPPAMKLTNELHQRGSLVCQQLRP